MTNTHSPHPWISERTLDNPLINHHLNFDKRFALKITSLFGSMKMFYFLVTWMATWIILATLGISFFRYDQYPFTFLLLLSNFIQLLALPILAVGQQILSQTSDTLTKQTYKDAETLLKIQDEIHRLIKINNELTEEIHQSLLKKNHSTK